MTKVLVTGSSGYIGRHLVKYLQLKGYFVVGLDRVDLGINLGDEFIHQDILDTNVIDGYYDAVVHLAALIQVSGGQKAMMDYYRTNVVGTMNLLERVDYKNFIFASTSQAESYNVYGQSKKFTESIIRQYSELNDKPHTIFRFGNVVGTAGFTSMNTDGLMYNLCKAKETGSFNLYGDGTAQRDYVHVMEICYAIEKSIQRPSWVPGAEVQPVYEFLGHGKKITVNECIETFKNVNNCDFEVLLKPKREGDPDFVKDYLISDYMPENIYTLEEMMKV